MRPKQTVRGNFYLFKIEGSIPGFNPGIPGLAFFNPEIPGLEKQSGIAIPNSVVWYNTYCTSV